MDTYFHDIVSNLSFDDLVILGILNDKEAELKYKAITKGEISEHSKLSDAKLRKSLYRLEIAKFIEIVKDNKEHCIFITPIGQRALFTSISKEVI